MPHLGVDWAELQACWERVRDSGHWTEGYFVRAFEDEVSRWCGLHAVAVNSAGTGLYAMLRLAAGLCAVAVPNNTFYATGAMARECQRSIVLVDCNREDFSMSFEVLSKRGTGTLGTVILTHVGGGLARDYEKIAGYCGERGIPMFEDAAHAFGVGEAGQTAGTLSDGAVFSLYPTKAIPAGEGGVIVTRHEAFADRLREFRNYGKYRDGGVIRYRRSGFNFRMDEWTAAVSWLQMRRRSEILERRDAAARRLKTIATPILDWGGGPTNWYKFAIHADEARELGIKRFAGKVYQRSDQLAAALGISGQGPFPNSEWVADNHVCLPIDEGLYEGKTPDEILAWLRGEA